MALPGPAKFPSHQQFLQKTDFRMSLSAVLSRVAAVPFKPKLRNWLEPAGPHFPVPRTTSHPQTIQGKTSQSEKPRTLTWPRWGGGH